MNKNFILPIIASLSFLALCLFGYGFTSVPYAQPYLNTITTGSEFFIAKFVNLVSTYLLSLVITFFVWVFKYKKQGKFLELSIKVFFICVIVISLFGLYGIYSCWDRYGHTCWVGNL